MKADLTAGHVERFRQQTARVVYTVLPVRALAGVVASYVEAGDVVHNWLRDHGPIVFSDQNDVIILAYHGAFVAAFKYGVVLPVCQVSYTVTTDCKVLFDDVELSLCDDTARYSVRSSPNNTPILCECLPRHYTCTNVVSTNGYTLLMGANFERLCTRHLRTTDNITALFPGPLHPDMETQPARLKIFDDLELAAGRISRHGPGPVGLREFVDMMSTFAFPDGFEHSWIEQAPGLRNGTIRYSDDEPRLCWTEAAIAGRMVHKTTALESAVVDMLQPMLAFIRHRKLGIKVTGDPRWRFTLVNERAKAPRRTGRKHSKPVRFSPL
jgi:hypothetical protein